MNIFIIFYLIFTGLAIAMCWQESKRRKISFVAALALSLFLGLILPIIGFIGAYIIILGIDYREEDNYEDLLAKDM